MSAKAAATRLNILKKAFELIYRNGYRTTSVDEIIATTQVTKGAFFYHFKNKDEMGIAMINEILYPGMTRSITSHLQHDNPKEAIFRVMKHMLLEDNFFDVKYGCPAINLVEELASYNTAFNAALQKLTDQLKKLIEQCLEEGKTAGNLRQDTPTEQAALFILSGYGGARNLGKIYGRSAYTSYLEQLQSYLGGL